jgi:hypothetical protein
LNSGRDSADKVENVLKNNEKERISLMDDVLLLEEDIEALEPISVTVATATAQSLQNMVLHRLLFRRASSELYIIVHRNH